MSGEKFFAGMTHRPAALLAFSWVTGYAAAGQVVAPDEAPTLGVILAVCLVIVWTMKLPGRVWVSCLLAAAIAACYYQWSDQRNVSTLPDELEHAAVSLEGVITSGVTVDGDRAGFTVRVWKVFVHAETGAQTVSADSGGDTGLSRPDSIWETNGERMQVSLKLLTLQEQDEARSWERGDRLELKSATLRKPSPARNFDGFDYRRYLRMRHIHWQVLAESTETVHVTEVSHDGVIPLLRWNDRLRNSAGDVLEKQYPGIQAGLMKALLIGLTDDMDPGSYEQFSQLGLTHILAISGLHVGIFVGGCLFVLRRLGQSRESSLLAALCLVPVYIVFTGASPSVVRAGLMAMIALFAAYRNMLKDGLNIACIVGVLMLLWNPYYLYNVSFQLSFIVTIGLIVFVPHVSRMLPFSSPLVNSSVAVAIVAQAVSFPVSIYYFNQFSLLSLLANLCIVPLFSVVIIPLGSASVLLGSVYGPLGQWVAWPVSEVIRFILWTVDHMSGWRAFHTIWPTPSVAWVLGYYVLAAWLCFAAVRLRPSGETRVRDADEAVTKPLEAHAPLMYPYGNSGGFRQKTRFWPIALSLCCFVSLLVYGFQPDRWSYEGRVSFIDVGQGDAILVRTPHGRHILVDGGGTLTFRKPGEEWKERKDPYEVGRKLLVPLLKKRGVQRIDYLILTHADKDHYGGLQAVVEHIPVGVFLFNGTYKPEEGIRKLFETVIGRGIPLQIARSGMNIAVDPQTEIEILFPFAEDRFRLVVEERQNDDSVVFLLRLYETKFLFTGDMEHGGEAAVVARREERGPDRLSGRQPVDVLKVAHHGSKTSTTDSWLDYWQPRYAVISAGQNNIYGHPHPDVVGRLKQRGVKTYRTDLHGEVRFRVTKTGLKEETRFPLS